MDKKVYSTPEQRAILESVQVPHVRGRSYQEAESLIATLVREGKIPDDWRRASPTQLSMLNEIGVQYSPGLSYKAASELLSEHTPATAEQIAFLQDMGAIVVPDMTRTEASKLIDKFTRKIPMSDGQARKILDLHGFVIRSMTYHDASQFIESLSRMTSPCNACSALTFRDESRCGECGKYLPKPLLAFPEGRTASQTPITSKPRRTFATAVGSVLSRLLRMIGGR